jgi:hypothetical protein
VHLPDVTGAPLSPDGESFRSIEALRRETASRPPASRRKPEKGKDMNAYQLKVVLQRAKPPVWSRLIVPTGIKFSRLRVIITEMMGKFGGHLYAFRFEEEKRILNHADKRGRVFAGVTSGDGKYERSDAQEVAIDELLREGGTFYFDCDFGDIRVYEIKVEKLLADCPHDAPCVIESVGDGASADIGGRAARARTGPAASRKGDARVRTADGTDKARADAPPTPTGPGSFRLIADRTHTMSDSELKAAFQNPETLFGYMIFDRKPVCDLYKTLESLSRKDLQNLASELQSPGRSRMNKSELVDAVYDCYKNSKLLHLLMSHSDEREIKALYDIMHADIYYVETADFPYDFALSLLYYHIVEAFYDGDRIAIIAFREFRNKYREALGEMREILDGALDELDEYACAAVNLYGLISLKDFMGIYLDGTDSDLDEELMRRMLLDLTEEESDDDACYKLRGDFLTSSVLDDWSDEELWDLWEKSKKHPLYVPPKEQFPLYADWLYFEETPAHKNLAEFIQNDAKRNAVELDDSSYKQLMGEICSALQQWAPMQECFDILESFGIKFRNLKDTKKASRLIMQVNNNTRIWSNNGATPNELLAQKQADASRKE